MIQGFFTTVQADMLLIANKLGGNVPDDKEQNTKVALAALRVFAAIGMGIGIVVGARALPFFFSAPVGTLFNIAIGVAIYAFNHDVFTISDSATTQMAPIIGVGPVDFVELIKSNSRWGAPLRERVLFETFFTPLWEAALARV